MKLTLVLAVLSVSYGIAAGNFLWDVVKGVSKGIEDSYKESEGGKLKQWKEKLEKRIEEHPKFKHHKDELKKLIHKAGNDIDIYHKKLIRRYGPKGAKLAKEKVDKHMQDINKWMSTLTKNDTDGEEVHSIPFIPRIALHKDDTWGERRKEKAEEIFAGLKKMWETQLGKKKEEPMPTEHLFGKDYKKIIPDFVKEEFKKQQSALGDDELKNLHKIDHPEKVEEQMPKFAEEVMQDTKKKLLDTGKQQEELLGLSNEEKNAEDKVALMKIVNKESDDLEKTVEELIPFLGQEMKKEESKIEPKEPESPEHVLLTTKIETAEEKPVSSKKRDELQKETDPVGQTGLLEGDELKGGFKEEREAEKKVTEEQKMFEEAEKLWESEIAKNAMEEIEKVEEKKQKTTEEKEVEEELKKPQDVTFTPPEDIVTTTEPETESKEEFKPIIYFNFDENKDGMESEKEDLTEEKVLPLPQRVKEPASLFKQNKKSESAFEEMSPEIQPLLQRLDDSLFRKKILREEKQWMKLKKWAKLLKSKKDKGLKPFKMA